MMTDCDEIEAYLETDPFLAEDEAVPVRAHLAACGRCDEAAGALRQAYGHLGAPAALEPDGALWEKIERTVERTRRAEPVVADLPVRLACTFCHGAMSRATTVYCAACLAPHHADCFATHGTCSVIGCAETHTVQAARDGRPRRAGLVTALRRHGTLVAATLLAGTLGVVLGTRRPEPSGPTIESTVVTVPTVTVPPAGDAPLTVLAELERTVLCDPSQPVHLVVTVAAREREVTGVRPPARIALVVDRSSSMSAEDKITFARRAVEAFLTGLGPQDRVTVIGFSNDPETVVPWQPGGVAPAHLLARLQPQGGTNLSGAIDAGAAALDALDEPGADVLRRVVVLTDGAPTVGDVAPESLIARARALQERGITLSCHGFGKDINAPLMISLAELGGGTFLYVDQGQLAVRAFEVELTRALGTAVTGTQVRIEPAPGVTVDGVVSWTATPDGAASVVHVGDLPAGSERKVVCRLRWSNPAAHVGELPLARVRWSAVAVADGAALAGEQPVAAMLSADAAASDASVQGHLKAKLVDADFASRVQQIDGYLAVGDLTRAREEARGLQVLFESDDELEGRMRANPFFGTNSAGVVFLGGELPDDVNAARAAAACAVDAVGR